MAGLPAGRVIGGGGVTAASGAGGAVVAGGNTVQAGDMRVGGVEDDEGKFMAGLPAGRPVSGGVEETAPIVVGGAVVAAGHTATDPVGASLSVSDMFNILLMMLIFFVNHIAFSHFNHYISIYCLISP